VESTRTNTNYHLSGVLVFLGVLLGTNIKLTHMLGFFCVSLVELTSSTKHVPNLHFPNNNLDSCVCSCARTGPRTSCLGGRRPVTEPADDGWHDAWWDETVSVRWLVVDQRLKAHRRRCVPALANGIESASTSTRIACFNDHVFNLYSLTISLASQHAVS
jgi:hypothetical protein